MVGVSARQTKERRTCRESNRFRNVHLEFLELDTCTLSSGIPKCTSSPTFKLRATTNPFSRGDSRPLRMWKPTVLLAAALAVPAQALHFFLDGAVQKCFYEELPKDTLVVGTGYPLALVFQDCWALEQSKRAITNNIRPLPRRALGRRDQVLPAQIRGRRLRNR